MPSDSGRSHLMVVASGVVLAAGLMLWWPAYREIASLEKQIAQTQLDLLGTRDQTQNLAGLARDVQTIRQEIASTSKTIPTEDQLSELLRELSTQMSVLALQGPAITSQSTSRGDGYLTLPLDISFKGASRGAFAFVNSVEQMQHLAQITQLRLESEGAGTIAASMRLNTFFYLTEETP